MIRVIIRRPTEISAVLSSRKGALLPAANVLLLFHECGRDRFDGHRASQGLRVDPSDIALGGTGYLGPIRIAPSRRMVVPFSMGLLMMWVTRAAYSEAFPSLEGCGTC